MEYRRRPEKFRIVMFIFFHFHRRVFTGVIPCAPRLGGADDEKKFNGAYTKAEKADIITGVIK